MRPSYLSQIIELRDRTAQLAEQFGIPNSRSLAIRWRENKEWRYLQIEPHPIISESPARRESVSGTEASGTTVDYEIKGISRKYNREQLAGMGIDYIVDAQFKLGKLMSGVVCQYVSLDELTVTWVLKLARKLGEKSFIKLEE